VLNDPEGNPVETAACCFCNAVSGSGLPGAEAGIRIDGQIRPGGHADAVVHERDRRGRVRPRDGAAASSRSAAAIGSSRAARSGAPLVIVRSLRRGSAGLP
jgi:hypothetical protein